MREKKVFHALILCANLAGVICLIYFAVPYLMHDTRILHPDAMLPAERWDLAGMALTVGVIPLMIVNGLAVHVWKVRRKTVAAAGAFLFLPWALCAALAVHYWVVSLR